MSEKPFSQYSQWHFKANAPMNSLEGTNSHGYWNYQTISNYLQISNFVLICILLFNSVYCTKQFV